MTTDRPQGRRPPAGGRRKRALASRIVAAGLSAVTSLVLVGTLARSDAVTRARRTDPPPALVLVPYPGSDATSPAGSAPPVTRSDAPPVTTSQAS
jgi:hypothetical protein